MLANVKPSRICVFGAGAIGGHLAAKFAAAGHDVSVIARGANLAAIRANGVALREGAQEDARTIAGRVRASDRASERVAALRGLLTEAGMHSPRTADIRQSVWDKLLLNFGSSLCAPLGEPVSALAQDPALRAVRERVVAEGRAIAHAHGVSLEDAPRRPGGAQTAGATAHKPSMLQNYEIGRPMEVDAILAVPCAFARAAGVLAPTLEAVHALVARLAVRKGLYSSP